MVGCITAESVSTTQPSYESVSVTHNTLRIYLSNVQLSSLHCFVRKRPWGVLGMNRLLSRRRGAIIHHGPNS